MSEYGPLVSSDDDAIRGLWSAVLLRALRDSIGLAESGLTAQASRAARASARRWFSRQTPRYRFACDAVDIEPDLMRARARKIYEAGPLMRSPCPARLELRDWTEKASAA